MLRLGRIMLRAMVGANLMLLGIFACTTAQATPIAIGYISFNVSGSTATVDITNLTGSDSVAPDFPVTTSVILSSLNLKVDFSDGSNHIYVQSDFSLSLDGKSWDGPTVAIGGRVAQPMLP